MSLVKCYKALDILLSASGAVVALGAALYVLGELGGNPSLLFSLGGSTIFLFLHPEKDAAQPRALFGGHLLSAGVGITCYRFLGGALWVSVLAVVLAMVLMKITNSIHPPAGANPLIMVQNRASVWALLNPVAIGVLILFCVAVLWSVRREGHRYPRCWR